MASLLSFSLVEFLKNPTDERQYLTFITLALIIVVFVILAFDEHGEEL